MLRPITSRRRDEDNKLWFSDLDHDLFVWINNHNIPIAFQFSYRKQQDEHCIRWHQHQGYSFSRVDSGETRAGSYKMTPVLLPDDAYDREQVAEDFRHISVRLDRALADFIYDRLLHYADD